MEGRKHVVVSRTAGRIQEQHHKNDALDKNWIADMIESNTALLELDTPNKMVNFSPHPISAINYEEGIWIFVLYSNT